MTREVPRLTIGWRVGGKIYATPTGAYYAIAKQLVVDKHPPSLDRSDYYEHSAPNGWSLDLCSRRLDRIEALFHHPDGGFDERRWRVFVRRVARFLRFVDERRGMAAARVEMIATTLPDDRRERTEAFESAYQNAEQDSTKLADYAIALDRAAKGRR